MQCSDPYDRRDFKRPEPDPRDQNVAVLWNAALVFGLCVAFASSAPHELFAASLGSLLVFAAVTCTLTALLRGEQTMADRLTHWDAAAVFLAMSIVLSWLADPEAVRAYLEAQGPLMTGSPQQEIGQEMGQALGRTQ